MPSRDGVTLTIAIPTFRRPERLSALLDALPERLAECPDDVRIDVLVVDNDPDGTARASARSDRFPVRYVVEPQPGIAAARNRLLDECADRDLIAFIDDDEIPLPLWLSSLIEVWRDTHAAAVMGRVVSVFDDDIDRWIIDSKTFYRPIRRTGTVLRAAAAGNLLLDLTQVREAGVRFDDAIGLGGGEDTLFSRQLIARGGVIVWCNESVTEDFVPAERLTRGWAAQRAYSSANSWARADFALAESEARRLPLRVKYFLGGIGRILVGGARSLYGRLRSQTQHDAAGFRILHRGRGMLAASVGRHYQEYLR